MVAVPEKKEISQIEKVQRRFTKRLRVLRNIGYTERLNRLGLPTLERRRLQLDLIFCYKIVFGLTSLTSSDYFQLAATQTPEVTLTSFTYRKTLAVLDDNFYHIES